VMRYLQRHERHDSRTAKREQGGNIQTGTYSPDATLGPVPRIDNLFTAAQPVTLRPAGRHGAAEASPPYCSRRFDLGFLSHRQLWGRSIPVRVRELMFVMRETG
jgi:hypothetical protein